MKHNLKIILWTCYSLISLTLLAVPPILEYFGKSQMMMHRFLLARDAELSENLITTPVLIGIAVCVVLILLGLSYLIYIVGKKIPASVDKKTNLKPLLVFALPAALVSLILLFYIVTGFGEFKAPTFFVIMWGIFIILASLLSVVSLSFNNLVKTDKIKAMITRNKNI